MKKFRLTALILIVLVVFNLCACSTPASDDILPETTPTTEEMARNMVLEKASKEYVGITI